jgi:hypothetical protein
MLTEQEKKLSHLVCLKLIKGFFCSQDGQQEEVEVGEVGEVVESPTPTYITVHTVNPSITELTPAMLGDGQLQHVVMETPDGLSENIVLQVGAGGFCYEVVRSFEYSVTE